MNKVGIYYAFWENDWDVDFAPYCKKVSDLGFDILEVNSGTVAEMSDRERDRLKNAALDAGIELTSCIGLPDKYDTASPDATVRENGVEFLKKQAMALAATGIHEVGGIVYSSWPARMPPGETKEACMERSVASLKEVMRVAEDMGVLFVMEVVNRFEQYLLNTADEAVKYVEAVGSTHCGVMLDTFHMNIEEDNFHDAIVCAGAHLKHFHIGETNRRAPGRGKMPWDTIFSALHEIGYCGPIVMEPFLMPGGQVGRDISVFRDLRGDLDLDQEAARACSFVKKKLDSVPHIS